MNVVRSYFSYRVLLVDKDLGTETLDITASGPQRLVLGPLLWNDGILRLELQAGCNVIGFTDDVSLLVIAKNKRLVSLMHDQGKRPGRGLLQLGTRAGIL